MPLPSQSARPIARHQNMYRRSRKKRRRRSWAVGVLVVVFVVVIVAVIRLWPETGEAGSGSAAGEPDLLARRGETQGPLGTDRRQLSPTEPEQAGRVGDTDEAGAAPPPSPPREERASRDPGIEMGGDVPGEAFDVDREAGQAGPSPSPGEIVPTPPDIPEAKQRSAPPTDAGRRALARAQAGLDLVARNEPVQARRLLTRALETGALGSADATTVRRALTELNERLVFSPEIVKDDPFALAYTIQSGDALSMVPRKMGVQTDWRFIARVNRIPDPRRIRPGQRIKLITGPFHAVIDKSDYRLDLYLGEGSDRVYVRSFPVGLGEYNSTPEGRFRVRPDSRLKDPEWVNPRTGRRYRSGDPDNPIGEHWIGLVGDEPRLADVVGYGIHGTIEPDSIGRQSSMGCVRLLPEDIEIIWEVLLDPVSTVTIRP
ncbi:MAG: L,D-transpeptidase family protein [Planctomycetota bacterium]|nr:L,D-transpeptidase family protein [Planctomycetota bacterium]